MSAHDHWIEEQLRQNVTAAVEATRRAMSAYTAFAGEVPGFVVDIKAEDIRADAVKDARVFTDRWHMMRELAAGELGAEIGVQDGIFSRFILDNTPVKRLHLFDLNENRIDENVLADERTVFHMGDSSSNLAELTDIQFDWIYIDGDHSYDGVKKDGDVAVQRIRENGILFFNDYTIWSPVESFPYGVIPVVNSLVNNQGFDIIAVALNKTGYFDVAVRRSQTT